MAELEENKSLKSHNVNTVTKGLNLDSPPSGQPEGTYRFALNTVNEDSDGRYGFVINEQGNYECIDLRDDNWKAIGSVYLEDDSAIIFLAPTDPDFLGFGDGKGYGRILRVYPDCHHEIYITSDCLNFRIQNQVQAEYRIRNGCEHVIYFTDDYNPPRVINIDSLVDYLHVDFSNHIFDNPDTWRFDPWIWDCSRFKLFPDYKIPNVDLVSLTESGSLLSGVYYFTYQYLDKDFNDTDWIDITQPVPIYKDPLDNNTWNIKGDPPNTCTTKAITLLFTDLDTSFRYLRIAYTRAINGTGEADLRFITAGEFQITGDSEEFVFSQEPLDNEGGVVGAKEISYNDILVPKQHYTQAKSIAQLENRLVLGNVKSESIDYALFQRAANDIQLHYTTQAISSDDATDDSPQSGEYYFNLRSFMRDEVYAFGIVWFFNDGKPSPVFHIAGRRKDQLSDGTAAPTTEPNAPHSRPPTSPNGRDSELIDPDVDILNTDHIASELQNANNMYERWQVYNTAIRTSTIMNADNRQVTEGEFGYFEASQGAYPLTKDCEGNYVYPVDLDGNGDAVSTPVRHHRMPDTTLEPHVYGNNSSELNLSASRMNSTVDPSSTHCETSTWDNQNPHADGVAKISTLGVRAINVAPPNGWENNVQGFKIVRARKKPSDQSVLDKGITFYNQLFAKSYHGDSNVWTARTDDCHFMAQSNWFNKHIDSSTCIHKTKHDLDAPDGYWNIAAHNWRDYMALQSWAPETGECIGCGEGVWIGNTADTGKSYSAAASWQAQMNLRVAGDNHTVPWASHLGDCGGHDVGCKHRLLGYPLHGNFDTAGDTTNIAATANPNWATSFANDGTQIKVGREFPFYPKPLSNISYHGPGTKFNTGASGCAAATGELTDNTSLISAPDHIKYEGIISGYQKRIAYNDACCQDDGVGGGKDGDREDGYKTYQYAVMRYHNFYVPYNNISTDFYAAGAYDNQNTGRQQRSNWSGENNGGAISPNCPYPLYNVPTLDSFKVTPNARLSIDNFEDIFENRFAQETYVIQTDSPSSTDPLLDITGNFEIPYPGGNGCPPDFSYTFGGHSQNGVDFINDRLGTAYYVSLKKAASNAYGNIAYLKYYNTHNGIIRWDGSLPSITTDRIFGGDSFISRFAFKQTTLNRRCGANIDGHSWINGSCSADRNEEDSSGFEDEWWWQPTGAGTQIREECTYNFNVREKERQAAFKNIVHYWVESYINTELRSGYDEDGKRIYPYHYEGTAFYGPISFVDPEYDYDDGGGFHNPATASGKDTEHNNFYEYNADYSAINDLKPYFPLSLAFDFCNQCHATFPQRVAYSENSFKEQQQDVMKNFLANNYRDLPGNRGSLWNLFALNKRLYIHMEESLFLVDPTYVEKSNIKDAAIYLGTGDFFSNPPVEMLEATTGFLGTQSQWATVVTENGTFFPDARQGKVFVQAGNQPKDIGAIGLRNWFEENMKINIYNQYINMFSSTNAVGAISEIKEFPFKDNPANPCGAGYLAVYDARHARYILTKKDYKILPPYDTNGQLSLHEVTGCWQLNDGSTPGTCPTQVFDDGTYWIQTTDDNGDCICEHSWTEEFEETIHNEADLFIFYDTTSLQLDYARAVHDSFEQWKTLQQTVGGILEFWTGQVYHIPVARSAGSSQQGGTNACERWVQWMNYGYLGPASFHSTNNMPVDPSHNNSLNYYSAAFTGNIPSSFGNTNYINIIVADEAFSSYHGGGARAEDGGFSGTPAGDFSNQVTTQYKDDYSTYLDTWNTVKNLGGNIRTLVYPVAHSTQGSTSPRAHFVLHVLAAVEGEVISNLAGVDGNAAQLDTNGNQIPVNPNPQSGQLGHGFLDFTAVTIDNPYEDLSTDTYTNVDIGMTVAQAWNATSAPGTGLKHFGVKARYDKRTTTDFDVDPHGNSVFGDDLSDFVSGTTHTIIKEYSETTPCMYPPPPETAFENLSWTISYSSTFGSWTSWHSYMPNIYIGLKSHFLSALNSGCCFPSVSSGQYLWQHGYNENHDNYQTYYGVTYPHIIDTINTGNAMQITEYNNVNFITDAFVYDPITETYVEDRYTTFDSAYVYNDYQISDYLTLFNKDANIETMTQDSVTNTGLTPLTRKERVWSFNDFRDMSVDRNIIPRPPMFTSSWAEPTYNTQYYIDKVINPATVSTAKEWYEQQRFRDKYLGIRLIFSNLADARNYRLVTNFLFAQDTYSIR